MKKILIQIGILIVLIILLGAALMCNQYLNRPVPYDATYMIDGHAVTLKNGISIVDAAPGSASKITTKVFGNELLRDFDDDGRIDKVFIITQETGGSGTFYYVVARLNKVGERTGSQALLLGDRIAPQNINLLSDIRPGAVSVNGLPLNKNIIVVNYADRKPGEDFATPPSEGKSLWLLLDTKMMQFGEAVPDFEGERDPPIMVPPVSTDPSSDMAKLIAEKWMWDSSLLRSGVSISPSRKNIFGLAFKQDGTVSIYTDCNSAGGKYTLKGNSLNIENIYQTEMYCEGSQESEYLSGFAGVRKFEFTSLGQLVLLREDGSKMYFRHPMYQ